MNIQKFQLMFRSKGIRIGDDDPMLLLLSENEKMLKGFIKEIQNSYTINVETEKSKHESEKYHLEVITAATLIITSLLIVVAFWLGRVWEFLSPQFAIGFGVGMVVGLVITVSVINIRS